MATIGRFPGDRKADSMYAVLDIIKSRIINVKDYGAVGDGSTNDAPAFNAAITAAAASNGTVFIPGGATYVLDADIVVPSNVAIIGDKANRPILTTSGSTYEMQ